MSDGDWVSVSRPHPPAFVARHDAPLIGEGAATRGRTAMEDTVSTLHCPRDWMSFSHPPSSGPRRRRQRRAAARGRGAMGCGDGQEEDSRRAAPPASHIATPAASDATRDAHARRHPQRPSRLNPSCPLSPAFVAHRDAPLIGDRAAGRGRGMTEGGDTRARVKRWVMSRFDLAQAGPRQHPTSELHLAYLANRIE